MLPDPAHPFTRGRRSPLLALALLFAVFATGMFIGYHSVYRNIAVAALHDPATPTGL